MPLRSPGRKLRPRRSLRRPNSWGMYEIGEACTTTLSQYWFSSAAFVYDTTNDILFFFVPANPPICSCTVLPIRVDFAWQNPKGISLKMPSNARPMHRIVYLYNARSCCESESLLTERIAVTFEQLHHRSILGL